jgi:hypothetical protein
MASMKPGDQWAYREHPRAFGEPVHRVEIIQLGPDGSVRVRWQEGQEEGLQEWTPRSLLLCPWDAAAKRLEQERRLAAVHAASADGGIAEHAAAVFVLQHAGLGRLVTLGRGRAERGVVRISRPSAVADRLNVTAADLAGPDPLGFTDQSGVLVLPWAAGLRVIQRVARASAARLLEEVQREREQLEAEVSRGWYRPPSRDRQQIGPEEELREREPVHAVVREWCGAAAVDRFDELVALRAEVVRLGSLVERAVQALRKRGAQATAATIERDLGVPVSTLTQGMRL